jgi:hypothetical protein
VSDEGRFYVKQYSPYTDATFWLHYALGDIANADHGYEIWLTNEALAKQWVALSARAIRRGRAQLIENGFLVEVAKQSHHSPARYRFVFLDVPKNGAETLGRGRLLDLEIRGDDVDTPGDDRGRDLVDEGSRSGSSGVALSLLAPLTNGIEQKGTEPSRARTVEEEFARTWERYPRKENRAGAFKAYKARRTAGVTGEDLWRATLHYAATVAGKEREFVMHGSTFYGPNDRWLDYLAAPLNDAEVCDGRAPAARRANTARRDSETRTSSELYQQLLREGNP